MAEQGQGTSETMPRRGDWEWFWRFLAAVMLFVIGWVIWIAIQISSPSLVTPAAYEAAAHAKARSAKGVIVPAQKDEPKPEPVAELKPEAKPETKPEPQKEPPVNMEKLRLSESIESAIPQKPSGK